MFRFLLRLALLQRSMIALAAISLLVAGVIAYGRLNIEAYPNPAPVILEITAQADGLSAEEMEREYTRPMEVGLANTPGVQIIRSTSFYGLSFVRMTFNYGVDYYFAVTQAALALQQNVSLPANVQPQIQASSLVGEIFRYQVTGPPHFGLTQLRSVQDWKVSHRLLSVPGVAQVVTWGGTTKAYDVDVEMPKLQAYGLTLAQVMTAIGNGNANVGGRTLQVGRQSINIRGIGLIETTADIGDIVLSRSGNVPVRVRDIASVSIGALPRLGKAGRDAQDDVVTGIVVMNRTMQTHEVVARVKTEVETMNHDGSLPPGVRVVPFYDRSELVKITTHTVLHNLFFGCVLVFFIQWLFLGDLRSAVIVSANIPVALFTSIIIMVLLGESANLLSVGAVDFGIIVDSAVIMIENIFRNLQQPAAQRQQLVSQAAASIDGRDRLRLLFASALQVDKAVLFSSAITVAAFIPLFTMQGVEGQIFGPMARTYAYALAGALVATFTLTPALSSWLLPEQVHEAETRFVGWLRRRYNPALDWALRHRRPTLWAGLAFLGLAAVLATRLGSEFMPSLEEGNLWIRATLPATISLESGMDTANRMRAILDSHPEVQTVVSQHGRPDDGSDASGFYNIEFFVPLKPESQWPSGHTKQQLVNALQQQFEDAFPGVGINFSQYIEDNVQEGLSGVKGANSVKIIGPDLGELERLADAIREQMRQVRGIQDLGIFHVLGQPNLNIRIDRARAARYGLNTGDVNTLIATATAGATATQVYQGEENYDLVVRVSPRDRQDVHAIENLPVGYSNADGSVGYVPLKDLADIQLQTGASYIYHERNERFIPVKFSVRDRDLGSTVEEARRRIAEHVLLPPGYHLVWSGQYDDMQAAIKRLEIVLPITLGLILVLLFGMFNSIRDSLLTLVAIPFSTAGGIVALYLSGLNLSVSAAIGFISLFGVSVMNGILIISYFNHLLSEGHSPYQAMSMAASQRMRPLLMTALSACLGLLPAAVSTGIGSQVQRPLAVVVVGGMLLGPLMLLVVAPALQLSLKERELRKRPPTLPAGVEHEN